MPSAEMLVTVMSKSVIWPKLLARTFSNSSISRDFLCCHSLGSPPLTRSGFGSSPHTRSYSQKTHKMEVSKGRYCFPFYTEKGSWYRHLNPSTGSWPIKHCLALRGPLWSWYLLDLGQCFATVTN